MRPSAFWSANLGIDLLMTSVSAVVAIGIFAAFGLAGYSGRNLTSTAALLFSYVFAIVPFVYPASFVFDTPSTAFVAISVTLLFVGLSTTVATMLLQSLERSDPVLKQTNDILKVGTPSLLPFRRLIY